MKPLFISPKLTLYLKSTQRSKKELRPVGKALKSGLPVVEHFLAGEMGLFAKGAGSVGLDVTLCGIRRIRRLNGQYRGRERKTDILAFPVHQRLRQLGRWTGPLEMGSLFICREVAGIQAKKFGITYQQEVVHLFVHGLLHLLGYDHERGGREEKIMFDWEDRLVKRIYQQMENGYGRNYQN